jgi:hypothetical protein
MILAPENEKYLMLLLSGVLCADKPRSAAWEPRPHVLSRMLSPLLLDSQAIFAKRIDESF